MEKHQGTSSKSMTHVKCNVLLAISLNEVSRRDFSFAEFYIMLGKVIIISRMLKYKPLNVGY